MKYKIITGHNAEVLTESVGQAMSEGWRPSGGVAVVTWKERGHWDGYEYQIEDRFEWSQAVTKEDWK